MNEQLSLLDRLPKLVDVPTDHSSKSNTSGVDLGTPLIATSPIPSGHGAQSTRPHFFYSRRVASEDPT